MKTGEWHTFPIPENVRKTHDFVIYAFLMFGEYQHDVNGDPYRPENKLGVEARYWKPRERKNEPRDFRITDTALAALPHKLPSTASS